MFTFTPLLGAQSDSPASQSLLELDGGVKILVDVGWDETFDAGKLLALEKCVHVTVMHVMSIFDDQHLSLLGMSRQYPSSSSHIRPSTT